MRRVASTARYAAAVWLIVIGLSGARADGLSEPVMLVATSVMNGSAFEQTVVLAVPLPNGGHIGFIVNKPTSVSLAKLLPDAAAARKVTEPVYFGGTELLPGVFAITRRAPQGAVKVLPLMPGLVAAIDGATVDRIMKAAPNDARYFVGLLLWGEDELEAEVRISAWELRPADVATVLPTKATGLWNSLRTLRGPTV